jgi:hypothetical protein
MTRVPCPIVGLEAPIGDPLTAPVRPLRPSRAISSTNGSSAGEDPRTRVAVDTLCGHDIEDMYDVL